MFNKEVRLVGILDAGDREARLQTLASAVESGFWMMWQLDEDFFLVATPANDQHFGEAMAVLTEDFDELRRREVFQENPRYVI